MISRSSGQKRGTSIRLSASEKGNASRSPHDQTDGRPCKSRILIVDVDLASIVSIAQTLARSGYVLSHATDESAAVKAVKEARPDLIICAFDEQNQETIRLIQAVQRAQGTRCTPVLFILEAHGAAAESPQILGPRLYLVKPFTREQLSLAVQEQLAHQAERSSTCPSPAGRNSGGSSGR